MSSFIIKLLSPGRWQVEQKGAVKTELATGINGQQVLLDGGNSSGADIKVGTLDVNDVVLIVNSIEVVRVDKDGVIITSTTGGLTLPRLTTTQRDAIVAPVAGETIYNTTVSRLQTYDGTKWITVAALYSRSLTFVAPSNANGEFFVGGFYDYSATDANLTQASTTQTFGQANHPYATHAFLVAANAGSASGGAGAVEIEVSGTSITDAGVRTAADTEILAPDITAMSTDLYFETTKKWLGQVTYTLKNASGSTQTTFSADFNYGLAKYEHAENRSFTLTTFDCVGRASSSDTSFNIELLKHDATGWTYAATGFVAGNTPLLNMNTTHGAEQDLTSGNDFAFKRSGLTQVIDGTSGEGYLVRVTTGTNNAATMNVLVEGII